MTIHIHPIPALRDNLIWLIQAVGSPQCVIVDPGEAQPVLQALQSSGLSLSAILVTHHHWDHTQGIAGLLERWPVPVFGPAREPVAGLTHPVREGDSVTLLAEALELAVWEIPGHTRGHLAYTGRGMLLSGDTLFSAGCGRVLEGSLEQLHASLMRLASLPDETRLYCGHEYTESNLRFALFLEPTHPHLQRRLAAVQALRAAACTAVGRAADESLSTLRGQPLAGGGESTIVYALSLAAGDLSGPARVEGCVGLAERKDLFCY